ERELVRPDRLVAELLLVGLEPVAQERLPALARAERAQHVGRGVAREGRAELVIALDLLLHPPQRLDRVPVPVLERALQATLKRRVDLALDLLDRPAQRHRRREL